MKTIRAVSALFCIWTHSALRIACYSRSAFALVSRLKSEFPKHDSETWRRPRALSTKVNRLNNSKRECVRIYSKASATLSRSRTVASLTHTQYLVNSNWHDIDQCPVCVAPNTSKQKRTKVHRIGRSELQNYTLGRCGARVCVRSTNRATKLNGENALLCCNCRPILCLYVLFSVPLLLSFALLV